MLALLLLAFSLGAGAADEQADRRVLLGAKLFPAVVAADQYLADKISADGKLHFVVLYREDAEVAKEAATHLSGTRRIKETPVQVDILPYSRLTRLVEPPAALFLAEWSPEELPGVARYGNEHRRLVFSPFKGDVAAGAQTGIFVSDRILPLFNLSALESAGIELKPFLLEIAKTNE